MVLEESLEPPGCTFCINYKDESELIEMGTNSICLDDEIIEFNELISNFFGKIHVDHPSFICIDCKNLLVQFHVFKRNVENSFLVSTSTNENMKKVKMFLDENEDEEVYCLRYNKCLTLVPQSKHSFMEIFKQWQPHVVLNAIAELPSSTEPPRKQMKLMVETKQIESNVIVQSIKEENSVNELKNEGEITEMGEEEWLLTEMKNSEIIETGEEEVVVSWVCKHCLHDERFHDSEEFRNHLISHLNEQEIIEEEEINYDLDHESATDEKYEISEPSVEVLPEKNNLAHVLCCKICNYSTVKPEAFRLHNKKHSDSNVDEKLFKSSRFEKLFCNDCSYQFGSQAHYQAHVNGHKIYEIVAKYSSFPICELCNMMFCDDSLATIHHNKHEGGALVLEAIPCQGHFLKHGHHGETKEDCVEEIFDINALKCGHCLKKFKDEESCQLHQLIFHVTELKCPIESRVFNGNQAFNIHLRNNHPELFGEVKFTCSVCKTEFETLYEKLRHMKTCDKKKFQCSHCDKKFSQKCYLMTHLKQISGQASVTCEICQKVCRDKGDYQIHFRSHSNVKPFKCSICPKAYKTSSARAAHLETHIEKGFNCSFCPTKFNSRRTLQKHIKTKHNSSEEIGSSDKIILEEVVDCF